MNVSLQTIQFITLVVLNLTGIALGVGAYQQRGMALRLSQKQHKLALKQAKMAARSRRRKK